ncbi:MAG: PQQ-binding-like beta-propeller repeat protein [Chloroflexia bacterium]|nr:PQQ-binding-like beta-propeller repeat protein [Chloroflexia bacterium]
MALIKKMGVGRKPSRDDPSEEEKEQPSATPAPGTRPVRPEETPRAPAPGTRPVRPGESVPTAEPDSPLSADTSTPTTKREEPHAPTLSIGAVLQERYQIDSVIGIGGMSVVYKGRDLRFRHVYRPCAIKEMFDRSSPDSQTRAITLKNFEREASLLATLNHSAITKIYDYFVESGRIYLVLEFIEGKNLEDILEESEGPLAEEQVVRWALEICDVLTYLHHHKPEPIVFRDMKPSNVMVTPSSRIVLIDFGIARIFEADQKGTMIGTEGYSPPEQYRGVAEPRGDVYALGATMHHLLTKSDPRLETPFTFHERPLSQLNPDISAQLEAVVMKALEYDARQRWNSAAEMRSALLDLGHLDVESLRSDVSPTAPDTSSDRLLWTFQCEEEIRATPLVYNGILYIGVYDNNLYALEAERGKFLWKFPTQRGICASAASWERLIVCASEDGTIYALNAQSGRVQWNLRTGGPVRSSPRIFQGTLYIGSDDQTIYAVDLRRGETLWTYRTWGAVRASAVVDDGNVYIGSGDAHIYALDAIKGELQWKYRTGHAIVSSPAAFEGMVFVGSWDSHVYALDQRSGWPTWKYRTGHRISSTPCVYNSRVYIGSADSNMYSLDCGNGKVLWKFDAGTFITSSPAVSAGKLYFGSGEGKLFCLDADSGKKLWTFLTGGPIVSSPAIVDGVVYIGSTDKKIYALQT